MPLSQKTLQHLKAALAEDIGSGDVTSRLTISRHIKGAARIVAKQPGIFCGAEVARALSKLLDSKLKVQMKVRDGAKIKRGETLLKLSGPTISILELERTLLNFLAHLSGVATVTHEYVKRVKPYHPQILDTRKTTPLWRELEKIAVKSGGGTNHRMGLYDQVFIKENHRVHGDLKKLKKYRGKFVIEVRNQKELLEAMKLEPKVILLDNFTPARIKQAVKSLGSMRKKVLLEASGGITLKNVHAYAKAGVNRISVGALTHSVKSLDFSLLME